MNFRVKSLSSVGLLALLGIMLPSAARADDFTFSFTNTAGGTAGTVTGEIFGLSNNCIGCAATDVTITSYPAAFNTAPGLAPPTATTDIFAAPWTIPSNTFTESGGAITSFSFKADATIGITDTTLYLSSTLIPNGSLLWQHATGPPTLVGGSVAFAPVAAPEPSSISLMLIGLVALGTLAAVSKRKPLGQSLVN